MACPRIHCAHFLLYFRIDLLGRLRASAVLISMFRSFRIKAAQAALLLRKLSKQLVTLIGQDDSGVLELHTFDHVLTVDAGP